MYVVCVVRTTFVMFTWPCYPPAAKCPFDAHFRILSEIAGHPGTFCPLLYEYCESSYTSSVHILSVHKYLVGKYVTSDAAKVLCIVL